MVRLAIILVLGGCGRLHFDPGGGDATGDGGPGGPGICADVTARDWAAWPMPADPGSGLPHIASYSVSADGLTVRDAVTGLVWQRDVAPGTLTWDQAKAYCAGLVLGGCEHWRLPERIELLSIIDYSTLDPAIDSLAFPSTPIAPFWTATPYGAMFAWVFASGSGVLDIYPWGMTLRARCVY